MPLVRSTVTLSPTERDLFDTLLGAVKHHNLSTTLRCAGGWVRDKLLGTEKDTPDIDIALDDMLGKDFAEKVRNPCRSVERDSTKFICPFSTLSSNFRPALFLLYKYIVKDCVLNVCLVKETNIYISTWEQIGTGKPVPHRQGGGNAHDRRHPDQPRTVQAPRDSTHEDPRAMDRPREPALGILYRYGDTLETNVHNSIQIL